MLDRNTIMILDILIFVVVPISTLLVIVEVFIHKHFYKKKSISGVPEPVQLPVRQDYEYEIGSPHLQDMVIRAAMRGLPRNNDLVEDESLLFNKDFPDTPRRIVCAANRLRSGLIVCGARHHDRIMNAQIQAANDDSLGEEQGFIDQFGTFVTREDALIIARAREQIRRRCGGDKIALYSENLY